MKFIRHCFFLPSHKSNSNGSENIEMGFFIEKEVGVASTVWSEISQSCSNFE